MPHNLASTNGKTAMAYYGETPWHELGTELAEPATAAEAITAAGLDYQVELEQLQTVAGIPVTQRRGVVRTDSHEVIGVVGNGYVPVQNRECFGFLDAVVADGGLRYHTAGALGRGERIWLLAKLPDQIRVRNSEDLVDKFLLLSNTHDGSAALRVFFTPIRVVCQNTLSMAEGRARGQGVAILHKGDLTSKIREAQRVLGLAERFYDDAAARINVLAGYVPSKQQLEAFFKELYFYCRKLTALIDPERGQLVTSFVVMEARLFVSEQSACFVVGDFGRRVAAIGSSQEHGEAIADLRYGDRRGPFFFRVELHAPRTTWR